MSQLALPMPTPTDDVLCAGCCRPVEDCSCTEEEMRRAPVLRGRHCGGCGLGLGACSCHWRLRRRHGDWDPWPGWEYEVFEHPALANVPAALVRWRGALHDGGLRCG